MISFLVYFLSTSLKNLAQVVEFIWSDNENRYVNVVTCLWFRLVRENTESNQEERRKNRRKTRAIN